MRISLSSKDQTLRRISKLFNEYKYSLQQAKFDHTRKVSIAVSSTMPSSISPNNDEISPVHHGGDKPLLDSSLTGAGGAGPGAGSGVGALDGSPSNSPVVSGNKKVSLMKKEGDSVKMKTVEILSFTPEMESALDRLDNVLAMYKSTNDHYDVSCTTIYTVYAFSFK